MEPSIYLFFIFTAVSKSSQLKQKSLVMRGVSKGRSISRGAVLQEPLQRDMLAGEQMQKKGK